MAQIRHEINIIDTTAGGGSGIVLGDDGIIRLDTLKFNGTATYYFEALVTTAHASNTLTLRRVGTTTDDASVSVASTGLVRSTSFTPPSGATQYGIFSASTTVRIKAARIIIIQNATTLTRTETQIEIGNNVTGLNNTSAAPITNPKYWKYTSGNFDGTLIAYAEATYLVTNDMYAVTLTLQVADGTGDGFTGWSDVATIISGGTSESPVRPRSNSFTLTAGRNYRLSGFIANSMGTYSVFNAKIIIENIDGSSLASSNVVQGVRGGTNESDENAQASAQSFKSVNGGTITAANLILSKTGSPTDTLHLDLVSTRGGSSLANATISGSSLTASAELYTMTFTTPYDLVAGNTYYLQLSRSPDTYDLSNRYNIYGSGNQSDYPDGASSTRNNNVWGVENGNDIYFELVGITGISKLEPQYLLANTLFDSGTSLQNALTNWDSTEWDAGSGTITYYFQADAADNSTSDVTLEQADGGGTVTNSTVTNIDNAQISSAMTMPSSEDLDTIADTNAGDVAAAKILVQYVFSAASEQGESVEPYHRPQYH